MFIRVSIRTRGEREEGVMRDGYTDKHHLNLDKKKIKATSRVVLHKARNARGGRAPSLALTNPLRFSRCSIALSSASKKNAKI